MKNRQSLAVAAAIVVGAMVLVSGAVAQALSQPSYTLIESGKKVYGIASHDFRNVGLMDYWWVGHDPSEGPFMAQRATPGTYSAVPSFTLPNRAVDGSNMDRHECGFLHLNDDRKIDMVCTVGSDGGLGSGRTRSIATTRARRQSA